jgi:hypothetical protein
MGVLPLRLQHLPFRLPLRLRVFLLRLRLLLLRLPHVLALCCSTRRLGASRHRPSDTQNHEREHRGKLDEPLPSHSLILQQPRGRCSSAVCPKPAEPQLRRAGLQTPWLSIRLCGALPGVVVDADWDRLVSFALSIAGVYFGAGRNTGRRCRRIQPWHLATSSRQRKNAKSPQVLRCERYTSALLQ